MAEPHVAVLTFPFSSHPISRLMLMCRLAREAPGVKFSFFNTSKSNGKLLSSHGDQLSLLDNIKLYDVEDGIPPGDVVLENDPLRLEIKLFLKASPQNFKKAMVVAEVEMVRKITCLLVDATLSYFSADLADELGVPWIAIWSGAPCTLCAYIYTDLIRERIRAGVSHDGSVEDSLSLDFVPGLSGMCVSDYWPKKAITDDIGDSLLLKELCRLGQVLPRAVAVVLSSFRNLNPDALNLDFESKFQTLLNLGFLTISIPPPPLPLSDSDLTGCLSWLDKRGPNSVAYISLGTIILLPESELRATADALEESGVPFLWSLPNHLKSLLPNGFMERITTDDYKQGKIMAWTNQVQILGHDSIGVHVTHCGNNSVNESLANEVPMICRPFWGDNFMNAKMIENVWKVGVRVEGGIITKTGLVKALKFVLCREDGKKMIERARALKEALLESSGPTGSATQDFKALVGLVTSSTPPHKKF